MFVGKSELEHLRELILQRLDQRDAQFSTEYTSMLTRLDAMNQFREQLREQAATFITREQVQLMAHSRDEAIQRLERRAANLEGRLWALGAVAALAVSMLGAFPHIFGK